MGDKGRLEEALLLVKFSKGYLGLTPPQAITALMRAVCIVIDDLDDEARDQIIKACVVMMGTRERDRGG